MKEIVGYPNYGYEDGKVWNTKTNKPLKGYVHYSVEYVNLRNNGKTKMYPVPKIAFCAIHHIPFEAVPRGIQFIIKDDGSIRLGSPTERNEKRSNTTYLVQAKSLARALRYVDEFMGKTMIDYDIVGLNETKIMDVFKYEPKTEEEKKDGDKEA